jgi:hypothetical protein
VRPTTTKEGRVGVFVFVVPVLLVVVLGYAVASHTA